MFRYTDICIMFMIVSVLITVAGIVGIVLVARYTVKGAERIGKDISRGMAARIERDIKRDIDSGKFFY